MSATETRAPVRPGAIPGTSTALNLLRIWREAQRAVAPTTPVAQRSRLTRVVTRLAANLHGVPDIAALAENGLRIGAGTAAEHGVLLDPAFCWLIDIGEECTFAPYATVLAHDAGSRRGLGYTRLARVRIGDRVFIGAHALILPGVTIGDDAVIGAGAVVTKDVAAGTVAAGVPARELTSVAAYAERHRAALGERPVWSLAWTAAGGITAEQREQMRAALADGEGYIE
jgi:maltose O-acetyltransferase